MGAPVPGSAAAQRAQALAHELTAMRPRPAVIVAIDDGEETPIRLVPGRGRRIQAGRAMVELLEEGKRIEARDAKGQYLAGWNPDTEPTASTPGATDGLVPTGPDAQLAFLARLEDSAFQRFTAAAGPLLASYQSLVADLTKRAGALEAMNMQIVEKLVQAQVDRGRIEVDAMRARLESDSDDTESVREERQMAILELFLERLKGAGVGGARGRGGNGRGDGEEH